MNELLNIFENKKSEYLDYLKKFIEIDTQTIGHGIKGGNEKNGQIFLENLFNELGVFKIRKEYLDDDVLKKALEEYNEGNLGHNNNDRYNLIAEFKGKVIKHWYLMVMWIQCQLEIKKTGNTILLEKLMKNISTDGVQLI